MPVGTNANQNQSKTNYNSLNKGFSLIIRLRIWLGPVIGAILKQMGTSKCIHPALNANHLEWKNLNTSVLEDKYCSWQMEL